MAARARDSSIGGSAAMSPSTSSSSAAITSVQVAVRIRPVTKADNASIPTRWQRSVITPISTNALQVEASTPPPASGSGPATAGGPTGKRQAFSFDHVLSPQDGQAEVFSVAQPLIQRFIEGYNVTILAYGQTSSGKSYTMGTAASDIDYEGLVANHLPDPQMGIIPRAVAQIFQQIKQNHQRSGAVTYSAKASFVEIYNEDLIDLLADSEGDARPLVQIREGKGGQIIWSGLREVKVTNVADVMNQLERGSQIRRTNETDMNATSSRSHAIFSLTLTQRKYIGSGPAPPPSAAHPPSAFGGGRTTPSGTQTLGRSGLPRPTSYIPSRVASPSTGSRSNTPSLHGALSGRSSASGLRPASVAGTIRSASPMQGHEDGHSRANSSAQDGDWTIVTSKFHFVDLAGSERLKRTAAQGDRIKEGISINSGLHALGNVISALGDPAKARRTTHIPYRDSKLTRLLQDSLGGNAHTLMIACVSPTEYNVSETVNTLQYANRARNIKNKAELNEIEPGWEDVDYLQTQVLKLRREIGTIRSGGTLPLPSVTNGAATGAAAAASTTDEVLEWRDRVTDLNHRVSKLVAENVKLKEDQKDAGQDAAFFAAAAEPVVIEYEKTIDKLEGDYNLVKAALSFTADQVQEHETTIEEQEARLASIAEELKSRETTVSDLQARLLVLQDRESSAESYARDLETRLASFASSNDEDAQVAAELRKEVARLRSSETSTEAYVKDLEARLAKAEDATGALTAQIERLEHDLERRDEAYKELQQRMELLDTGKENKELLEELDRRDTRLLDLERRVEELADANESITKERGRLTEAAAKDQLERGRLEDRIRELQTASAAVAGAGVGAATVVAAKHLPLTNGDRAASRTSVSTGASDEEVAMLRTELEMLHSELEELRASEAKFKADAESLNQRYRESLREIDDLNTQVSEAKLLSGPRGTASEDDADSGHRPIVRRNSIGYNVSGSLRRPRSDSRERSSQTPSLSRRNSGSFLYKTGDKLAFPNGSTPSLSGQTSPSSPLTPRGRTSSQSLSQELSRGPRPLSLSASGTVPAVFFDRPEPSTPASYERTIKSLETETMRLQEALKERDEEIHSLERSLKAQKDAVVVPSRPVSGNGDASHHDVEIASTPGRQSPDTEATTLGSRSSGIDSSASDRSSMPFTPATENEFKAIRQLMSAGPTGIDPASSEVHVGRLEEMMRSMARKDQTHREAAESAQQKIDTSLAEAVELRRQKEALEKLSSDQMANMSAEIEGLRTKLAEASTAQLDVESLRAEMQETKERLATLSTAQADLLALRTEMDLTKELTAKREKEHADALQGVKDEYDTAVATAAARHAEALEDVTRTHTESLQKLSGEHQALLDRTLEQHSAEIRELKAEHGCALQSKEDAYNEALSNADLSRQASVASTEEERDVLLSKLQADHKLQLERVSNDHADSLERALTARDRAHMSELEAKATESKSSLAALQASHSATTDELKREHNAVLEAQSKEHNEALEGLTASHTRRMGELLKEHEVNIAAAVQAAAISYSRAHEEATQSLSEQHRQALADAEASAGVALQKAKDEHESQLVALRAEARNEQDALRQQHASELQLAQQQHDSSTEATNAELVSARQLHAKQLDEHAASLEGTRAELSRMKSAHEDTQRSLDAAKAHHASTLDALKVEQSLLVADREAKLQSLISEHESLKAEHETVKAVNRDLDADPNMIHNLQVELADTSEALLTFEGALTEAQRERDVLAQQVQGLQAATNGDGAGVHERNTVLTTQMQKQQAALANAQSDLAKVKGEVQTLTEERQKQDILLRDLQAKLSAFELRTPRGREGSGVNGFDSGEAHGRSPSFRRGSSSEIDEYRSGARTPTAKPPPPTPPPSMPPPPTPVGSISRNSGSVGPRTSTSSTMTRPESPGFSNLTRSSSTTSLNSHGPSLNGLSDAKLAKLAQEQAEELQKMAKRLEHCETDLSANIDLVATLEAALNDSERNLRKSRAQLGETTRERDSYAAQADDLRKELDTATTELERTRNSNIANQQGYESKLQAERQAKENARLALEARLEEVQRKKSSKLFCM